MAMNCEHPIRIKNQYSGKWLYVPCRHCDACKIADANKKSLELSECHSNYKYSYFLTLTYAPQYVPYVIRGLSYIFRGPEYEVIDDLNFQIEEDLASPNLQNHHCDAVGVIYYRDFQLFFKRFRKYLVSHYGKEHTGFKYFCVCEYGSRFGRPHAHIDLLTNDLSFEQVFNAARESWSYHDWNRFQKSGINEACKVCTGSCASYISSYVNCINSNLGISQIDDFRQKTFRSKSMDFGTSKQNLERFKEGVRRIAREDVDSSCNRYEKPFFYLDTTKNCDASLCLLSQRYIFAAFAKPTSYHSLSFVGFVSCALRIMRNVNERRKKEISLSAEVEGIPSLKSADLAFYRSYNRHKYILGEKYGFLDYLRLHWKVHKYYASCLLLMQMIKYESIVNKDDYFLEQIDTCVENLNKKRRYMFMRVHGNYKTHFKELDLECPPESKRNIIARNRKYRSRLLPKHMNDVNKILYV